MELQFNKSCWLIGQMNSL